MKSNSSDIKSRRRKLSRFLCQEMLYDYIMDKLDPNRKESVREYLVADEQTREALDNLREGLSYTHKLRGVSASRPLLEQLLAAETTSKKIARTFSFRKLPVSAKLAIEAVGISTVVAVVVSLLPWNILQQSLFRTSNSQTVEIANVERPQDEAADDITKTARANQDKQDNIDLAKSVPEEIKKIDPDQSQVAAIQAAKDSEKPSPIPQLSPETSDQFKGFVYRGFVKIQNVDGETPKIADALRSLGATKAGEVDLGWRRGRSSYFHFSLGENNYDAALKSLKTFGVVRIYREPHRRVMPEGQIRFILWVEPTEE